MNIPKKLDARRKENRLNIVTRRAGPGDWTAEAFGMAACAGTKSGAVKLLREYFADMRGAGIGPRMHQLLCEVHALRVGKTVDGEDGVSLKEAAEIIGHDRIRKVLRRDYSKTLARRK